MLSRRAYLEETQREQRDEFLTNLKPGEIRSGVVSSVVNFGAFVDLGGMDGLVHVSELSWKHVDHPSSVVQVGDEVTVQVLDVDLSRERISLSLKATQQDPWQEFAAGHQVGELVYGRVTKLVPFGAFVQVGEGIEGLVHISEMAVHHVEAPEQVVTPGEELWVKIIDIDLDRRRISLSIKQAAEGGVVAAEYQEHFGEHAYDEQGNYIGPAFEEERRGGRRRPTPRRRPRPAPRPTPRPSPRPAPTPWPRRADAPATGRGADEAPADAAGDTGDDACRIARSGEIPGPCDIRLKAAPTPADDPRDQNGSPRGVAVSNRRTLMAAAAIVLALVAGIGVYMYASGADKRAAGERVVRRRVRRQRATSPRARPVPELSRPGSITQEKVAKGSVPPSASSPTSNELADKVDRRPIDTKQFITAQIVRVRGGRRRRCVRERDRARRTSSRSR